MLARALVAAVLVSGCGGPSWTVPLPSLDRVPLSVTAAGAHDVWAAGGPLGSTGETLLLHYDGAAWTKIPVGGGATLWWVFELSPSEVYAVGEKGTIVRWDGATVTPMASGTTRTLYGIWGASADDLWAVGGMPDVDGVLLHKDASGWHQLPSPTVSGAYFKVWGSAANDVFVCGQGATILHWDGAAFTRQPTSLKASITLFTIAGRSPTEVYAVGGLGSAVALRYDGSAWSPLADAVVADTGPLSGVSVDGDGTVVMVGANGTVLHGKPGALKDESRAAVSDDLHAASIAHGEIFVVGGNYLAPAPAPRHGVLAHYGGGIASALR